MTRLELALYNLLSRDLPILERIFDANDADIIQRWIDVKLEELAQMADEADREVNPNA